MHLPIVFVHGFIGHLHFPELRAALTAERVISPDLLGYGRFASMPAGSLRDQVVHLERQIAGTFGSEPVLLVGHSGGAAVCVQFAQAFPSRVAGIVSAEGNLAPSDAYLSSRLAPMAADKVRAWLEQARNDPAALLAQERVVADPVRLGRFKAWLDHQSSEVVHAMARALLVETVHPGYASAVRQVMTHTPTYFIRGARSGAALGVSPQLIGLGAGCRVIPEAGHLMVIEAPEAFSAAVAEIARELCQAPAREAARALRAEAS
jgi:pimeloyl-ACP methyl ester carboxylesterase